MPACFHELPVGPHFRQERFREGGLGLRDHRLVGFHILRSQLCSIKVHWSCTQQAVIERCCDLSCTNIIDNILAAIASINLDLSIGIP